MLNIDRDDATTLKLSGEGYEQATLNLWYNNETIKLLL